MANEALEALGPDAKAVLEQAKRAYYECWYLEELEQAGKPISNEIEQAAYAKRSLQWRADLPVSMQEAVAILTNALGVWDHQPGYNFFRPMLLEKLGPEAEIVLAREYSVCIYVKVGTCELLDGCLNEDDGDRLDVASELEADELHRRGDYWRLWWD